MSGRVSPERCEELADRWAAEARQHRRDEARADPDPGVFRNGFRLLAEDAEELERALRQAASDMREPRFTAAEMRELTQPAMRQAYGSAAEGFYEVLNPRRASRQT